MGLEVVCVAYCKVLPIVRQDTCHVLQAHAEAAILAALGDMQRLVVAVHSPTPFALCGGMASSAAWQQFPAGIRGA